MRVRQISILVSAILILTLASFAANAPSPTSGKELYQAYCASCHGIGGQGNGPVASALKTPPTDLTLLSKNNSGKYPEMHVLHAIEGEHGRSSWPKANAGLGTAFPPQ